MTGLFRTMLAGCALAMLLGPTLARAEGGTVSFSGSIVAPTCAITDAQIQATSPRSAADASQRFACGRSNSAVDAGRAYALTEATLDPTTIASDRVLAYFADYLSAAGITGAKLVTQTFE